MNNKLYGFVVLHYLDYEMTQKCVTTLTKNFNDYNYKVVIVDNASNNGSAERLQDLFKDNSNIKVIINAKNLGFAQGNNVGYEYIQNTYEADYIVVMNNDVLIRQRSFLDKIESIYAKEKYYILGPDIYCPLSEKHQNPSRLIPLSEIEVKKTYDMLLERKQHYNKYFIKKTWLSIFEKRERREVNAKGYDNSQRNVVLHGACYIFSKQYIKIRKKAFNPNTFLYLEEEILYFEAMRDNMLILYSPKLKVEHLEDISTKKAFKSEYIREKMITENKLRSIKILYDLMTDMRKKDEKSKNDSKI